MIHGPEPVAVVLSSGSTSEPVVNALRTCCAWSPPEIVRAIKSRSPLPVGTLFGVDHHDQLHRINHLLDHLAAIGQAVEVHVSHAAFSREQFNERIAHWHAAGEEVDDDIESGFWNMKNP